MKQTEQPTPTPAPAPMTAEDLRVLGMKFAGGALTIPETADLFRHIDALTARVSRLLEAVEGAEKALERIANHTDPHGDVELSDGGEQDVALFARSALATLRAAREGAR